MQTRPSTLKSLAIKQVFKEVDVLQKLFFDHDILARLDAMDKIAKEGKQNPLAP
jgi:hypothetical protein